MLHRGQLTANHPNTPDPTPVQAPTSEVWPRMKVTTSALINRLMAIMTTQAKVSTGIFPRTAQRRRPSERSPSQAANEEGRRPPGPAAIAPQARLGAVLGRNLAKAPRGAGRQKHSARPSTVSFARTCPTAPEDGLVERSRRRRSPSVGAYGRAGGARLTGGRRSADIAWLDVLVQPSLSRQ